MSVQGLHRCRQQGSDDGLVKVWSLQTGQLIYTLRGHTVRDVTMRTPHAR